jgi:hypothetical protein
MAFLAVVSKNRSDANQPQGCGGNPQRSIEQIFSPLVIGVPHQSHDVATGVEIE